MKRKLLLIMSLFVFCLTSWAQTSPNALGLRLGGDGDLNGAEFSYQHMLNTSNRLELDLGFYGNDNNSNSHFAGIYHWVWNLNEGLNWYAGPGAQVGLHNHKKSDDDHVSLAVGGQIGIEYNFTPKAPIQISLDGRPMWDFIGNNHGLGWGLALGVRYVW